MVWKRAQWAHIATVSCNSLGTHHVMKKRTCFWSGSYFVVIGRVWVPVVSGIIVSNVGDAEIGGEKVDQVEIGDHYLNLHKQQTVFNAARNHLLHQRPKNCSKDKAKIEHFTSPHAPLLTVIDLYFASESHGACCCQHMLAR